MGPSCFPLLARGREVTTDSLVPCIEDIDVPGVRTDDPCERECDIVLIVVTVLDSVIVVEDSLRATEGEWGEEAKACSSSSFRVGPGSLGYDPTRSGLA